MMLLVVQAIEFYKAWDRYGALSNFSPHPIVMPENAAANGSQNNLAGGPLRTWQTLEHYYQAQKFAGIPLFFMIHKWPQGGFWQ